MKNLAVGHSLTLTFLSLCPLIFEDELKNVGIRVTGFPFDDTALLVHQKYLKVRILPILKEELKVFIF